MPESELKDITALFCMDTVSLAAAGTTWRILFIFVVLNACGAVFGRIVSSECLLYIQKCEKQKYNFFIQH